MTQDRRPIVILHGWSDESDSFEPLAQRLAQSGRTAVPLWLGDYVSLDDDVTLPDIAQRLEAVLRERIASGELQAPMDMIVHSTGGLVARQWLVDHDRHRAAAGGHRWLHRLVMLAPANHGSRLAATGKSMVGRLTKGLGNWFQTGTQVLSALELGSPYQWGLVLQDVLHEPSLGPAGPFTYGPDACLPFTLTGSRGYTSLLRRVLNEDGADGVVRVAAANLWAQGATLDFSADERQPRFTPWHARDALGPYALALLDDEDHSSIVQATGARTWPRLLQALECPMEAVAYRSLADEWARPWLDTGASAEPTGLTDPTGPSRHGHTFLQLNTFVVDDRGQAVDDHFIEFFGPDHAQHDEAMAYFHREVLAHVHRNTVNGACRCFHIDRTDLMGGFYDRIGAGHEAELQLSLSAAPPGPNARYFASTEVGAAGHWTLHGREQAARWLRRHTTHYLRIVIPRHAGNGVLRLRPWPATQ